MDRTALPWTLLGASLVVNAACLVALLGPGRRAEPADLADPAGDRPAPAPADGPRPAPDPNPADRTGEELRLLRQELADLRDQLADLAAGGEPADAPRPAARDLDPAAAAVAGARRLDTFLADLEALERIEDQLPAEEFQRAVTTRTAAFLGLGPDGEASLGRIVETIARQTAASARDAESLFEDHRKRWAALEEASPTPSAVQEVEVLLGQLYDGWHRIDRSREAALDDARSRLAALVDAGDPRGRQFLARVERNAWIATIARPAPHLPWAHQERAEWVAERVARWVERRAGDGD